jgi:hypothetical protein
MFIGRQPWEDCRGVPVPCVVTLLILIAGLASSGGCGKESQQSNILGKNVREVPSAKDTGTLLMISSGSLEKCYEWSSSGARFQVAADASGTVVYLCTKDPSFRTPKGVRVGMPLNQALPLATDGLKKEPGWAYYVTLPSGWCAAFVHGQSMTEDDLPQASPVVWLFRR